MNISAEEIKKNWERHLKIVNTFIKGETIISQEIRERLIEMGFYF